MDEVRGRLTPSDISKPSELANKLKSTELTRREFFTVLAAAAGSLMLGRCLPSPPAPSLQETPPSTPPEATAQTPQETAVMTLDVQERFRELGMEAFWPFYSTVLETTEKYDATAGGYYFTQIFDVCQKIAAGEIEGPEDPVIVNLKEGWGIKKDHTIEAAIAHIESIDVIPYKDARDDPKTVREQQLTQFARNFAPMALALPPELHLVKWHTPELREDRMLTYSFTEFDPKPAWFIFFHEVTHAVDTYPERVKPYVSREQYLEYITTYFQLTDNLLANWFKESDQESAVKFWGGLELMRVWGDEVTRYVDTTLSLLARVETELFGHELAETNKISRFRLTVWHVGKKIQAIQEKRANNELLTAEEEKLLNNPDIRKLMTSAIQETLHLLVNTPYSAFYPEPELSLHSTAHAQQEMSNIRIHTFATFQLDPSKDTMEQVRKQLGIE